MKNTFLYSKFLLLLLSISVPLIALASLLNIMSYSNMVTEVYANANSVNASSAIQQINYSLSFGKSIEKFYDLKNILTDVLNISDDIKNVTIINNSHNIISSVGTEIDSIPDSIDDNDYVSSKNGIFVKVPINDNNKIVILLDDEYVNNSVSTYVKNIVLVSSLIILCIVLISFIVYLILKKINNDSVPFTYFKPLLMSLLIISQVALGSYVLLNYTKEYINSLDKMANIASNVIENDIESIVAQGIPYDELYDINGYLKSTLGNINEIVNATITKASPDAPTSSNNNFISNKIQILDQEYYINIEYTINQDIINKNIINLTIEALILVVVTILISIEFCLYIGNLKINKNKIDSNTSSLYGTRIFFFVLFLTVSLDSSFISIVSYQLFTNMNLQTNSDILIGLPTTLGSIATIIGLLICLVLVNKIGTKKLIIIGSTLMALGSIYSGFCDDLISFSISRCISGLGFAGLTASTKLCAVFENDSKFRVQLLAIIAAGKIAGTSCGIVIGGLISSRTSYSLVFILKAILIILSMLLINQTNIKNAKQESAFSISSIISTLKSSKIIAYLLLIIIPIYMAGTFVSYAIPLYGNEILLSQSLISGIMMLNCMLSAYTSNTGTRIAINSIGASKSTLLYITCIVASIMAFGIFNTLPVAIIVIIILALADGFGLNIIFENIYTLQPNIDTTTITFMFFLASQIARAISPMLISSNIKNGVANASTILAYILAGGTLLYILFLTITKKSKKLSLCK